MQACSCVYTQVRQPFSAAPKRLVAFIHAQGRKKRKLCLLIDVTEQAYLGICRAHLLPAVGLIPALAALALSPVAVDRLRSSPISSQLLSIENLVGAALPEEDAPCSDSTADPLERRNGSVKQSG